MSVNFSISEIINGAWEIVKKNIGPLIIPGVIYIAAVSVLYCLMYIPMIGAGFLSSTNSEAAIAGMAAGMGVMFLAAYLGMMVVTLYYQVGINTMSLKAVDGKIPEFSDFRIPFGKILNAFLAGLLLGIIVSIGFILCIIPGIYLAIRFQFFIFFIIDKDSNAIEALSGSWNITKGIEMDLFIFDLILALIAFLGLLCCGIGIILAYPIIYVSLAMVYRRITGTTGANAADDDFQVKNIINEYE